MSLARRDYTLMQGMFLIITVAVVLANLVAELLNSVLDPRLRVEG
jgi:peptide/nickel transport system permease protein